MRLGISALCVWLFALVGLSPTLSDESVAAPSQSSAAGDRDVDGDGLSDFQELHKYHTDPCTKSSAGTATADGDWDGRRQFAYSVRAVIRVMPPYNLQAVNDDYQDVRVLDETAEFVELEVTREPVDEEATDALAEEVDYGMAPMMLIASGIDADGNLVLSGTEQRKKTIPAEIKVEGKKTTVNMSGSFPLTFLKRQTVSLKDATICDREGNEITIDQARERLKEPTPVLLARMGQKVDPIYRKIMREETLTFNSLNFDFKQLAAHPAATPASTHHEHQGHKGIAVKMGEKVPDFSVQTLDGKTVKLSELQKDEKRTKDGIIVLSFWCSTCSSCRSVEQHLDQLAKDYAGRAAVIALDVNAGETAEQVAAFALERGLVLPIVLDASGRSADVFGAEATTTTVVIDGDGVLRYYGRFRDGNHAYAEEALKAVLEGKDVAAKTTEPDG